MINIALPKGSLEEQTLQLFKEADLEVRRTDRDYNTLMITDERSKYYAPGDTDLYEMDILNGNIRP
jgi:ATP phosphoribosyltransferase